MKYFITAICICILGVFLSTTIGSQASYKSKVRCGGHYHKHTRLDHRKVAEQAFNEFKIEEYLKKESRHMRNCAVSDRARFAMRKKWRAEKQEWVQKYIWVIRWFSQDEDWRAWAKRTSACESDYSSQHDSSGTFHGGFQFMLSTWASSPLSPGGDPHYYPWLVQAVVAIKLAQRDGTGHWPVCG